jgi:hypothetical protein
VSAPVIITRVVNAEGRPFNVTIVRDGDHYGRDDCRMHDSEEPLIEFWDATYERDPHATLGLGRFAARFGLGTLIGLDGYGLDYSQGSMAGLHLFDYVPDWEPRGENVVVRVTGDNLVAAIAAARAALLQVDAADAKEVRCARCDAGFLRRRGGVHLGCDCPHLETIHKVYEEPCECVFVAYDDAPGSSQGRWLAYVDGSALRKQSGDERRYASADAAYEAAREAAPVRSHDHPTDVRWRPLRPPPRAGTTTALVLEILSRPRDFAWLTAGDIVQLAAETGTPVKPSSVMAALSNLEREGSSLVEVNRTRKPFRYRRGSGKLKSPAAKLSEEMLVVLRQIAASHWGQCGSLGTRHALIRRGLVREVRDEEGRIRYEISAEGTQFLEDV